MELQQQTKLTWPDRLFWPLSAVVFVIIAIRSYVVPIHHDEAATFFFYIQTGDYLPFFSHIDANNHVLNSTLSFVCFKLFGDSLFSLRLPNTLSFLILAFGTWRFIKQSRSLITKSLLTGGLILSFHFLTFYSTCRGYGLSMALLVLALSCFLRYLESFSMIEFLSCLFIFQLAISSNLILIIVMLPVILLVLLSQFANRQINWKILLAHLVNLALLYYWIRFSFFLQDNDALYYGEGESYYKTTYLSLSHLLSGHKSRLIAWTGSIVLLGLSAISILNSFRKKQNLRSILASKSMVFTFLMGTLIIGFCLLKKLMGINYPEDRTGLFFYVFFILFSAFVLDDLKVSHSNALAMTLLSLFIIHFCCSFNVRKHSLVNYESVPQRFYGYLAAEQVKQAGKITVSGHRMRELFYAYDNYRNGGALNLMDGPDFLQMSGDYAIALKNEKKDYDQYYTEVDSEPDWNYVLLKRKQPVTRKLQAVLHIDKHFEGTGEFYEFMNRQDTLIDGGNPILGEFQFQVKNKDVPNRSWLVMQIDTGNAGHYYYKRIPLNWLHYKWDETKTYTYDLTSGPLDKKISSMKFYIYNPLRQNIGIYIKSLKLYELRGEGVKAVSTVAN